MSYVYITSESYPHADLFTVGFYKPDGAWEPESDHKSRESAAGRVAYLNGGGEPDDLVETGPTAREMADRRAALVEDAWDHANDDRRVP